jgi:nucleoside-diphosphate-sugar epimerase
MRAAMQGVDGVYHVAGWYKVGVRDKTPGEKVNIQGTRNVLELMQELAIPKGVYTSTVAINSDTHGKVVDEKYRFTGKHLTEYDRTKAEAHHIAEEFIARGLPLVIVMPGGIYGPGDTSVLRKNLIDFLREKVPAMPTQAGICWGHIDDTAHAHILAMEKGAPGETYIIAGEPCTFVEAFQLASNITGKRAPVAVPYQVMKTMSYLVRPFDNFLPEMYTSEGMRILSGVTYWADNSKAKRFLSFNPRPLREGLESTLRHEMSLLGM